MLYGFLCSLKTYISFIISCAITKAQTFIDILYSADKESSHDYNVMFDTDRVELRNCATLTSLLGEFQRQNTSLFQGKK